MVFQKNITTILKGLTFPLFGAAFYRAWLNLSLAQFVEIYLFDLSGRAFFDAFCALTALVLVLSSTFVCKHKRTAAHFSIGLLTLSSLFIALVQVLDMGQLAEMILEIASLLCAGVGLMMISLLWIDFYASFNPVRMAMLYAGALVFGDVITVALLGYRPEFLPFVALILPLISGVCLTRNWKNSSDAGSVTATEENHYRINLPWKPALFIGIYAFAYAMSNAGFGTENSYPMKLCAMIAPILVISSVLINDKKFNFERIYALAFPFMVCCFLLLASIPGVPASLTSACATIGYASASMLVVLIVCGVSFRSGVSAFRMFAFVKAVQYLGMSSGMFLRSWLNNGSMDNVVGETTILAVVIALVVIISVLFITERNIYFGWGVNATISTGDPSDTQITALRIDRLASVYGLTPRETEVLLLLTRGKTVSEVADDLFIAKGTAKAHVQHLYNKLGIHSREEIFGLLGQ